MFEIGVSLLGNKTSEDEKKPLDKFEIGVSLLGNKTLP